MVEQGTNRLVYSVAEVGKLLGLSRGLMYEATRTTWEWHNRGVVLNLS